MNAGFAALVATAWLSVVPMTATAQAEDPLKAGKDAWDDGEYQRASELLALYIAAGKGPADYNVHYMLATSWCRISKLQSKGAELLAWIALRPDVSPRLKKFAVEEFEICKTQLSVWPPAGAQIKAIAWDPKPVPFLKG